MKIETEATLLSAISSPYEFQGNKGISHRIRLNVNGEIFVCKSTAEQVLQYAKDVGQVGVATFLVSSPKEALKLVLVDFKVD